MAAATVATMATLAELTSDRIARWMLSGDSSGKRMNKRVDDWRANGDGDGDGDGDGQQL